MVHFRSHLAHLVFSAVLAAAGLSEFAAAHDLTGNAASASVAAETAKRIGTFDQIIVDDTVRHIAHRIDVLRAVDGTSFLLEGVTAQSLQRGARVEVTGTIHGKSLRVSGTRLVAKSAPLLPDNIVVDGTLAIAHADDFANARSQFVYEIHEQGGAVHRLDMPSLPAALEPGMKISVGGRVDVDGQTVFPSRISILALPTSPAKASAKESQYPQKSLNTVLVILANFNNTPTPPFSQASAQDVMTNNASSVGNYFNEVSFGLQTFSVTVTTWVTMSMSQPSTCDWPTIGNAASTAAANNGWNPANYGFVVYLFPQINACGWNGLGYISSPHKAYINGTNSFVTQVITHEMGHNFGLLHAGSLDCGAAVIGGSCSVSEYGDPFDTMANQRSMHYNAAQKRKLNWIASSTVSTHSAGTIAYSLTPIESAGGTMYAIKIPTANANRTYWVEYRQPLGFDSPLSAYPSNGAQIRVASPFETMCSGCDAYSNDTQILDMTPGTSTFTDAALVVGQSFTDATYGVTINVLAASASALTVQVSTGGATSPTTTTISTSANPVTYGSNITFTGTVNGNAPTGTINFTDGGASIGGCTAVSLTGSGNSRSATCSTNNLNTGTHTIVATYSGDGSNVGSASSPLSELINTASTTTSIASSANPSAAAASVTFTASVSGVAPTGAVNFTDGGTTIAGCGSVLLVGSGGIRIAQCSTNGLSVGTHAIAAAYSGDGGNAPSTSPALSQVVNGTANGSVNVALAANGGVATASSTINGGYPASAINNGDRTGAGWSSGGGWNDGTVNSFPDWVQIQFNGTKTIDHIVVYTLQDNYLSPAEPSDASTFTTYGVTDFDVQAWNGSSWVTLGAVSGNNLVKRTINFAPFTTDRIRVNVTGALGGYSRIVEIEAFGVNATASQSNVAAAANGAIAIASSTINGAYPASAVNNGDRSGAAWGSGGGWNDATLDGFPDWIEIQFNGQKTIDHVIVYTLQDNYISPIEPTDATTFSLFGITDFTVEGWTGSSWVTLGVVSGNTLVKRSVAFGAFTTDRIRVNANGALAGYSRIVEIEALGVDAGPTKMNVASVDSGGVASASSSIGGAYPVSAINNGDRTGVSWGNGGGWNDGTLNAFPDWAQIAFNGAKTIDRVVVYTLADNYFQGDEPTDVQTFSLFGITDFTVDVWNGSGWTTVAVVNGNNLVKRTVTFTPVSTDRIRINVTNALSGYARVVEIEAWGL